MRVFCGRKLTCFMVMGGSVRPSTKKTKSGYWSALSSSEIRTSLKGRPRSLTTIVSRVSKEEGKLKRRQNRNVSELKSSDRNSSFRQGKEKKSCERSSRFESMTQPFGHPLLPEKRKSNKTCWRGQNK